MDESTIRHGLHVTRRTVPVLLLKLPNKASVSFTHLATYPG